MALFLNLLDHRSLKGSRAFTKWEQTLRPKSTSSSSEYRRSNDHKINISITTVNHSPSSKNYINITE